MEKRSENLQTALELREKHYIPVAIYRGSKEPAECWGRWMTETPTVDSIHERWTGTDHDVAVLCKDLLVFDVDREDEDLLAYVLEQANCKEAPICKTPSGGFHVHTRARRNIDARRKIKVRGKLIDLLAGPSLSILPPSAGYTWLTDPLPAREDLPFGNIGWTRTRRRVSKLLATTGKMDSTDGQDAQQILRRGRAYVDKFTPSIAGQNGHTACFVAALKIVSFVRQLGGTDADAWALLNYFNATKCEPEWSEPELKHKFNDALQKAR
jgi:hypothetical protein